MENGRKIDVVNSVSRLELLKKRKADGYGWVKFQDYLDETAIKIKYL